LGAAIDLPAELTAFLDRPTPQSLIIRGAPGTGKSLLALAILEAFSGPRIYVSSRVPRSRLEFDIPRLGRLAEAGQLSIVDMTAGGTDLRTASRSLESARELVEPEAPTDGLRSLLLPPEVLEAWSQASPSAPTLIVLDSWDAIVERHVDVTNNAHDALPSREELERVALAQMAQAPIFLVMVIEHADAGQLEYLTDGVVAVIREIREDRTERWLHIEKLRGTRIAHSSYPFSLEGGRFQSIAPLGMRPRPATPPIDRQPSPSPGQIWPGSSDYASFFGRLPIGKLTLLELDPEVPNSAVAMMVAPLLNQVVAGGGRVLHIPPPGMQPTEIWKLYQGQTSKEDFLRQVRLLCPLPGIEP
jgi:KaiC/GvpD/RAD55 family RecA-like ATPase